MIFHRRLIAIHNGNRFASIRIDTRRSISRRSRELCSVLHRNIRQLARYPYHHFCRGPRDLCDSFVNM